MHLGELVCDHCVLALLLQPALRRLSPRLGATSGRSMDITQLLAFSVKNKASDLHLSAGLPPMIRVHGDVRRINVDPLEHKQVHDMVYDIMNDSQRKNYEETLGVRLLVRDPGPGALSRQRLQPEPRRRRRVPDHSVEDPDARAAQLPGGVRRARAQAARHGAVHRPDRLGQVDHAGGDGQPPERERVRPRADGRGPDRVRARIEEVPDQPARGRPAHAELRQRAALGAARGPGLRSWWARCATWRRSAWR